MKLLFTAALLLSSASAFAGYTPGDYLIKMKPGHAPALLNLNAMTENGGGAESLGNDWIHVQVSPAQMESANSDSILETIKSNPDVEYAQPNYNLQMVEDYKVEDPSIRATLEKLASGEGISELMPQDMFAFASVLSARPSKATKPELPSAVVTPDYGPDPLEKFQWGMKSIHAEEAWKKTTGNKNVIVAVIDTGVDYTHPDLVGNLWQNTREIPNNGKDDDGNGYVDDIIGWDFAKNDNKPFDVTGGIVTTLLVGGNPGHGTHCAGNVGAVGNNSIGISGVAPNISIMALRFLDEKGHGTSAGAVKAINYAVANGAKVLSNSWGSEGDDPGENNQALKEAIDNAQKHDVLFVAAAGNGHKGIGYDNDTDARPGVPASYKYDNIVSVAAIDSSDHLGKFSNWGKTTVHVAAPGVAIYSTMVKNRYSDAVFSIGGMKIPWDGTSMATPHVAGAAALVWSTHPEYTYAQVKQKLISTATPIPELATKLVSGGKINVEAAIQ